MHEKAEPRIIGLTGGIACGKSTVSGMLREMGHIVLDADAISREVTGTGGAAAEALKEAFGEYFDGEGRLDRRRLGAFIFQNEDARKRLEGIVHPLVIHRMSDDTRNAGEAGRALVFWDVPLLYESGMDAFCEQVIVVAASRETQLERILDRDHLSREEALSRIDSQLPLTRKVSLADHIIENEGSERELREKLMRAIESIMGDKE